MLLPGRNLVSSSAGTKSGLFDGTFRPRRGATRRMELICLFSGRTVAVAPNPQGYSKQLAIRRLRADSAP